MRHEAANLACPCTRSLAVRRWMEGWLQWPDDSSGQLQRTGPPPLGSTHRGGGRGSVVAGGQQSCPKVVRPGRQAGGRAGHHHSRPPGAPPPQASHRDGEGRPQRRPQATQPSGRRGEPPPHHHTPSTRRQHPSAFFPSLSLVARRKLGKPHALAPARPRLSPSSHPLGAPPLPNSAPGPPGGPHRAPLPASDFG